MTNGRQTLGLWGREWAAGSMTHWPWGLGSHSPPSCASISPSEHTSVIYHLPL